MSYTAAGSCPLVQAYSRILSTAVLGQPFTPACDDIDGNLASIQTAVTGLTANYVDFSEYFNSINVIICIIYFSYYIVIKNKMDFLTTCVNKSTKTWLFWLPVEFCQSKGTFHQTETE